MREVVNSTAAQSVAVAISSYNGSLFINEQLASIFNQSCPVSQVSVWDDCSSDDTFVRVQAFAASQSALTAQRAARNAGVNQGFQAALGGCRPAAWYALSDQDDIWPADRIERFLEHAQTANPDTPRLLVCQFLPFHGAAPQPDQSTSAQLLNHLDNGIDWTQSLLAANPMYGCCFLFNEALRRLIGEIPPGKTTHDYWIALLAAHFGQIQVLDFVGTYYRQHSANASFGAPTASWLSKLKRLRRSLLSDSRSRQDMVPLIQGLLNHPQSDKLHTPLRARLGAALAAYQRGGWALIRFQQKHQAWARRPSQNTLRVVSCLTDFLRR